MEALPPLCPCSIVPFIMVKILLRVLLALVLAFTALLFFLADTSQDTPADLLLVSNEMAVEEGFTIAFGSCNNQRRAQDYWMVIGAKKPDVWLWLGDNVYSDTEDMEQMATDYATQQNAPAYRKFRAATPQMFGIWDDHDYGLNDGGKEWIRKDEAKEILLDFLEVPTSAKVRTRPGAYQAYTVGPEERPIKIILLDTRYFRDPVYPPVQKGHRYGPNPDGDILGEAQWAWLEAELTDSDAYAHLIASSIQVIPEEHGYEKWALFPQARTRLLDLIATTKPALPLLLSGDRHLAEISELQHQGVTVREITASGLTHSYEAADEPNRHRISALSGNKNFGLLHFYPTDSLAVIAEVHAIEEDRVVADLFLPKAAEEQLRTIVNRPADMPQELKPCPQSPNCVSTQSTQPDKKREPIAYLGTLAEAKAKMKKVVGEMSRTQLKEEKANYLRYTFKTFPIPFIDDVEFVFDDEAKHIHFRSASRVGHSDLGANSRRMAKVVKAFLADE